MKKHVKKPLKLTVETVRVLERPTLEQAAGGSSNNTCLHQICYEY
ncbi:MAG TPA: hypothetical protein VFT22_15810 [Kofleriaceae bacterium]|nr:hypothetical protein [Kofleriaceae bacterium]